MTGFSTSIGNDQIVATDINISADIYRPIRQDAILLSHGADNAAALDFMVFLRSDEAREQIALSGYGIP